MVTEEEAKKRWCPFVRLGLSGRLPSALNRIQDSDNSVAVPFGARCIASECMAFRWLEPPGPRPPDAPERDDRGYCGLSGPPQS
jgi:hypothetical protein